jgi:hypothetical protein
MRLDRGAIQRPRRLAGSNKDKYDRGKYEQR